LEKETLRFYHGGALEENDTWNARRKGLRVLQAGHPRQTKDKHDSAGEPSNRPEKHDFTEVLTPVVMKSSIFWRYNAVQSVESSSYSETFG
jgi:hypothetical protein